MTADRTWLQAFRGIPEWQTLTFTPRRVSGRDLIDALDGREAVRRDVGYVKVHVSALKALADRIDAQSRRIAELEGAGPALGAADLEAYEAAPKGGMHVLDADSGSAAVYTSAGGYLAFSGEAEYVKDKIKRDAWAVHSLSADHFIGRFGSWPSTLPEFQQALGLHLREKRAAEVEAAKAAA